MKIQNNERNLLIAIVVCVLLVTGGVSFAYFIAGGVSITGDAGGSAKGDTHALVNVKYDAGDAALSFPNAMPGVKQGKQFSVTVTPHGTQNNAKYAIKLKIDTNTFVKGAACTGESTVACEDLIYVLKDASSNELASGPLSGVAAGTTVLYTEDKTVASAETFRYTLEVQFASRDANQSNNMGKSFSGQVLVEFAA